MHILSLRNAILHADILPASAGGLARLDWLGEGAPKQVLRALALPPGAPPPTPSQLACFPLVPWSNRIGNGGFEFEGRRVPLQPNRAGEPCPVHGDGWQYPWEVLAHSDSDVLLALDRRHGEPYSYEALLRYRLDEAALVVTLTVTNTGSQRLPFGLGLHPWMVRSEGVLLQAAAGAVWTRGANGLPVERIDVPAEWDFNSLRALPAAALDNVFEGWDGSARITWPDTGLTLTITADMSRYIVYAPPAAGFFCFEPVDHSINAHNLPGGPQQNGLSILDPGATLSRSVNFAVS